MSARALPATALIVLAAFLLGHFDPAGRDAAQALAAEGVKLGAARNGPEPGKAKARIGGNVRREGGKVWIEGVPNEQVGGGWLAMLRGVGVLLKHRGEQITEADLLAYSGDAFHLCFADKWQYMGYMAIPTDIVANVLSACGYDGGLRHTEPMPKGRAAQKAVTAKLLAAFRAEIEAGRPVLVGGSSDGGCCDWSVVVGYEKPTGKLCHMGIGEPYRWTGVRSIDFPLDGVNMGTCWNTQTRGTAKPNFVGGWIDNAHVILSRKAARPDERTRAVAVLQRAVKLHRAPTHDPRWGWKFHFGAKAYEKWAEAMDKLDYPADTKKPHPKHVWGLYDIGEMARMADTIVRGRAAAADFCQKAAGVLPKGKGPLLAAAKAYREESATAKSALSIFLTGTEDQRKAWLSNEANREAGVAAIRQMLEKERAAVAAIEKALAAEGIEASRAPAAQAGDAARCDYSKLKLQGNGHTHDSFSLTIQAAAKLLGKDADYETIYALSTNAFAPCVDPLDASIHWRHTSKGRGLGVDIVAGRLGLVLRELPQPDHSRDPKKPAGAAAKARWMRDYYRKPMIKPIREALEAGQVVIVGGSWYSHPPSGGLNPWCWWGIVLEARDDGAILGASLNGRRDNPLECTCRGCWAVTAVKPTLTGHEADVRMLRLAVSRIRGDAEPFLPTERSVFGLAAMDLWIDQMKQVPYCPDCGKGRSVGCAFCCAQPTFMGADTARRYLRARKSTFAAAARPHIEAAAGHYEKILDLLRPALTGKGGPQYHEIIGNLDRQKAHAEVLEQVKGELAAAADAMEKALAAEGVKAAGGSGEAKMTVEAAEAFIGEHGKWWHEGKGKNEAGRRAVIKKHLEIAERFKGTETGAKALFRAANIYTGACNYTPPLGRDGWDRAIEILQRVTKEYPGTIHARQARWNIAMCHGCFERWDCCKLSQGKQDWAAGAELYQQLYETAETPAEKCNALRRKAECLCSAGDWRAGLAVYRKIFEEFQPPSGRPAVNVNRTCGSLNGMLLIEYDIMDFTFRRLMRRQTDADEAIRLRAEFVRRAPDLPCMKHHTLNHLEAALRRLGETKKADEIHKTIGLCQEWLVVGPFHKQGAKPSRSEAIKAVYGPEKDILAGELDFTKAYTASTYKGKTGKAMWFGISSARSSPALSLPMRGIWEGRGETCGAYYALAIVESPRPQDAQLRIGVRFGAKAWLNGKEVLAAFGDRCELEYPVMDQNIAPIRLRKGRNQLVVKIANCNPDHELFIRITDADGLALRDITYSVPEVPAENLHASDFVSPARKTNSKYGFRYDPVKWVERDRTLQGAMVRAMVFKRPRPEDTRLLQKKIDEILAKQREDGSFAPPADKPKRTAAQETGGQAHELLKYGCPADHPKLKKAVDFVCRAKLKKDGKLVYGELRLACLTGWREGDEPVKSLKAFAAKMKSEPERGACPWTIGEAPTLWDCRKIADVEDALVSELRWNAERMNAAGFNSYKDPWAYLEQAGQIDHPLARQIVLKQIPMILRSQRPNGTWGRKTFAVLRALVRYDLLEPLRKLPALPSDWKIVRAVPIPEGATGQIAWGDGKLWLPRRGNKEIVGISPKDGKVLAVAVVNLPAGSVRGLGWWDDSLAVTTGDKRKELLKIDPKTGRVQQRIAIGKWLAEVGGVTQAAGKLWIADGWNWVCVRIDPKTPDKAEYVLMACPTGGHGTNMAAAGDGIWHYDNAWNAIVKTSVTAKAIPWNDKLAAGFWTPEPLDWGEKPFAATRGIAWDGKNLWVLDGARKRICLIEKSGATKWEPPKLGVGFIRKWLMCGPFPSPALPEKELAAIVEKRKDEPHVEHLRGGHHTDYLGGEATVRPKAGQKVKRPDGKTAAWRPYVSPTEQIWLNEVFGEAGNEPMVAYAFATIHRDKAGKAHLAIGSDDSAKVYLNGKLVHDAHVARPLEIDEDVVPVEFQAGENHLLIKIENALGTGGFIARPLDALPARGPALFPGKRSSWFGFERYDFKVDGRNCTVVTPRTPAAGKPWIWRARFFAHEPQTDVALLRKGFHLVYMDVAGMWGSDEAVAHWDAFHEFLTKKHGLSKRAALEGMSRGGLIIYNWGARNPDKVTCIYGDAPCCNFKATRGFEEGEPHVDNEYLIKTILSPLAKANVPLIHVCGDADESVPFEEHTRVVETWYKQLGGTIKVIVKPGVGHHPHSLKDPTPIVDFILESTSAKQ